MTHEEFKDNITDKKIAIGFNIQFKTLATTNNNIKQQQQTITNR